MGGRSIKQPLKSGVAKVPVIMQLEALECGAASLAMLMAYYDKWVPLEQVRIDCGVSRDGSKAKTSRLPPCATGSMSRPTDSTPKPYRRKRRFPASSTGT